MNRGFVYVVFGRKAEQEAEESIKALRSAGNAETVLWADDTDIERPPGYDNMQASRWAKLNLDSISPFDVTCYLDADTRPRGKLTAGFEIVEAGWDMAIAPSQNQGGDLFAHVDEAERRETLDKLENPLPLQLQAGVMFFRKCEAVERLFRAWRDEYVRYRDQDQAALIRALEREPVRIWLLGGSWNGGSVVEHLFGRAL